MHKFSFVGRHPKCKSDNMLEFLDLLVDFSKQYGGVRHKLLVTTKQICNFIISVYLLTSGGGK